MDIKYSGLKNLNNEELLVLDRTVPKAGKNVTRLFPEAQVAIMVKKQQKKNAAKSLYSLNVKLEHPHIKFAARSDEWDLATAIHMVFDKLENEIHHKWKK